MSCSISTGDFAREHLQDARRQVYSSLPKNLPENLSKALGTTWWLLEIVRNIQTEHTKNPVLTVLTQNQICVQSAELLRESISEAKDAVAPVLDKIRLAAVDRDIVSFGKVSETTAFDAVLKEADRTLAAVEAEKIKEDELVDMLSSCFPLPPPYEEWESLKAKLEKEVMRVGIRRLKKVGSEETYSETENAADTTDTQADTNEKKRKKYQMNQHAWNCAEEYKKELKQGIHITLIDHVKSYATTQNLKWSTLYRRLTSNRKKWND